MRNRGRCSGSADAVEPREQLADVVGVGRVLAGVARRVRRRARRRARRPRARCRRPAPACPWPSQIATALSRALPSSVSASRPRRRTSAGRGTARTPSPRSAAISATLSGLADGAGRAASARHGRGAGGSASISSCRADDLGDAALGRPSSASSSPRRERHALGGALHLDEAAAPAGHHDVHVDLGRGVLDVGRSSTACRRRCRPDRGARLDAADARRSPPALHEPGQRVVQREVAAADRRRAGAAVGLEHVAVDDRPGARRAATMSLTARSERPMSRWISCVRPLCLPFAASRSTRSGDEPGSIEYSAVTQPLPVPFIQRGTSSSIDAVHSTGCVRTSRAPSRAAISVKSRSNVIGRSSSARGRRDGGWSSGRVRGIRPAGGYPALPPAPSSGPSSRRPRSANQCDVAGRQEAVRGRALRPSRSEAGPSQHAGAPRRRSRRPTTPARRRGPSHRRSRGRGTG